MKTRRDFIKISSLGLGAVALAPGKLNILGDAQAEMSGADSEKLFRTPTYCEICFWKCAGWTYLNEKKEILKVEGNEKDLHCNGRFCPRGTGGIGSYYDKDRLTKPLIREGKPGNQTFREATWDEAFNVIAKKLQLIAKDYGPENVALIN